MCRVFGCVAAEPVSIRHELLEAENPLIRQSEDHDSGWGMAVYERADGAEPRAASAFPRPPTRTTSSWRPHDARAASSTSTCAARRWAGSRSRTPIRSASATTRSATTARSCAIRACSSPACAVPTGDTDSEHLFNFLMRDFDPGAPVESLRGRPAHNRSALALLRAQLPLLRRRAALRLPARASSSCTGSPGPGSCWWRPSA